MLTSMSLVSCQVWAGFQQRKIRTSQQSGEIGRPDGYLRMRMRMRVRLCLSECCLGSRIGAGDDVVRTGQEVVAMVQR